jgi:hypothetical protein
MQPQSTNPPAEHEAFHDDGYDTEHLDQSGPHIIRNYANLAVADEQGLTLYYTCDFCGREHSGRMDWDYASANGYLQITKHCVSRRALRNTVIQVNLPRGHQAAWEQGRINPGTVYPAPMPIDDYKDYEPREPGPCPTGCIKEHDREDMTEEHYSITRTNIIAAANQETPRLMVRTQQFMINTDPADVQWWVNVQLHDLDHQTHQEFDLSKDQTEKLITYLMGLWLGADTLEALTPAQARERDQRAKEATGE